jgi:hypothetical protein
MIKKLLTCKTYVSVLKGRSIVARLGRGGVDDEADCHKFVTDYTYGEENYLIGPIADRLYAYEQLGYSPEELREIISRYQMYRSALNTTYGMTIMGGRANGKSLFNAARILGAMEEMQDEYERFVKGEWPKKNPTLDIRDLYPSTMIVPKSFMPTNVIFSDPATIVFWNDGTKTVVRAQDGEEFDPEKGLAMAISKKALGNKHGYYNIFKKWLKKCKTHQVKKLWVPKKEDENDG